MERATLSISKPDNFLFYVSMYVKEVGDTADG